MLKQITTLLLIFLCLNRAGAQSTSTATGPLSVNAGADKVICPGGSASLNAVVSGGVSPFTYSWSPATGLSNTSVRNPIARPTQNTRYIVTITDSLNLLATDTVLVSIDSNIYRPVISIASGANPFCEGTTLALIASSAATYHWTTGSINSFVLLNHTDTVTVRAVRYDGCIGVSLPFIATMKPRPSQPVISFSGTASVCNGSLSLSANQGDPVSFNWNTGESGSSITVSSPGTYSVYATNASGCSSQPTEQVVTGLPVGYIISSGNQTFCSGDSLQISVSTDPANTITWSNGSTDATQWVTDAGDYSAILVSPEGCTDIAQNMVTVTVLQPPPPPVITSNGPTGFCDGGNVVLQVQNAQAGMFYSWSTGDDTDSIMVQSAGEYSVRALDDMGCASDPAMAAVTVFPLPSGTVETNGNTSFCAGDSITLNIQAANTAQFIWNNGSTTPSIQVKNAGQFSALLISAQGCTAATSNSVSTTVRSLPSAQITQNGNRLELVTDASEMHWYFNGQDLGTGYSIPVTTGGPYQVTVTKNGCTNQASATAILRRGSSLSWQVYPNPVQKDLHIVYTLSSPSKVSLSLHDAAGRVLLVLADADQAAGEHNYSISSAGSRFSPGIYFIVLSAGDKQETAQVLLK